jgi:hypothetical protein
MLPQVGLKVNRPPRALTLVRDLEVFEGPILSEYKSGDGGLYLEKWCARDDELVRTLLVRTERRAVAMYLAGRTTMRALLTEQSDGIGFLLDRANGVLRSASLVMLDELPPKYLPTPSARHDESLRPEWQTVPQNFFLDEDWDAKLLATIERRYQEASAFSYLTTSHPEREFPRSIFLYEYDRGFPIVRAFQHLWATMPPKVRTRAAGITANSPGVLTLDAPSEIVGPLKETLQSLSRSRSAYKMVHSWSRLNPKKVEQLPSTARQDLDRLCELLGVEVSRLVPVLDSLDARIVLLVAGKLVAAYYRKLWQLVDPDTADYEFVEAVGVRDGEVAPEPDEADEADEDEDFE